MGHFPPKMQQKAVQTQASTFPFGTEDTSLTARDKARTGSRAPLDSACTWPSPVEKGKHFGNKFCLLASARALNAELDESHKLKTALMKATPCDVEELNILQNFATDQTN
jgi:hypothetical protein